MTEVGPGEEIATVVALIADMWRCQGRQVADSWRPWCELPSCSGVVVSCHRSRERIGLGRLQVVSGQSGGNNKVLITSSGGFKRAHRAPHSSSLGARPELVRCFVMGGAMSRLLAGARAGDVHEAVRLLRLHDRPAGCSVRERRVARAGGVLRLRGGGQARAAPVGVDHFLVRRRQSDPLRGQASVAERSGAVFAGGRLLRRGAACR